MARNKLHCNIFVSASKVFFLAGVWVILLSVVSVCFFLEIGNHLKRLAEDQAWGKVMVAEVKAEWFEKVIDEGMVKW